MTEFRKNHPIVYGAVAVALGMAVTLLVNWLFDLWVDDGQASAIGMASALVVKLVPAIVAVAFPPVQMQDGAGARGLVGRDRCACW